MKKTIALLSGGIDSPVAAGLLLKQGIEVVLVHFYNQTPQQLGVQNKVQKLAEQLARYGRARLLMVPFREIQLEIIKKVPAEYRMLVYRRMMFRIAEAIKEKEKADALVTGDNLAQVASQTIENMRTIYAATKSIVIHPLLGKDKREITDIAKNLGTFEISSLPYEDCCSYMIAKHPATKSSPEMIEQYEKELDITRLVDNAVSLAGRA